MFRRAKLMLADVPTEVMAAATVSSVLEARLGLTDATGNPVCARVKPPAIRWTAGISGGNSCAVDTVERGIAVTAGLFGRRDIGRQRVAGPCEPLDLAGEALHP